MWELNAAGTGYSWVGGGKPTTPPPPLPIKIPAKGSKAQKTYIWFPDAKGELVKMESSVAKKSFATLTQTQQTALAQFLINTNVTPTTSSLKSVWDKVVDGAVAEYKAGKKSTPFDVLTTVLENTPINTGITETVVKDFSPMSANAYLNNVAATIGYDITALSDDERADFAVKLKEAAGESGKQTTRVTTAEGKVTTVVPDLFDPKAFAENWLWAKVNLDDVTKLPSSAVTQLTSVKKVLDGFNIDYLSQKEINQLSVDLASKKLTTQGIIDKYRPEAIKNYPHLADRLNANPNATVMDILDPAINIISKWLEIPKSEVKLNNKFLDKYARPDGVAGKVPMPSLYDLEVMVKTSEDADKTSWANEAARDGAVGLARAMGFGI